MVSTRRHSGTGVPPVSFWSGTPSKRVLFEVIQTDDSEGFLLRARESGQEETRQYCDYRDDHEQFDQGEAAV